MYSTRTRVHARILNGHLREEKPDKSRRTSRRAERASRGRPRAPDTPTSARSEVGEEVRVGVGPVEFKLNYTRSPRLTIEVRPSVLPRPHAMDSAAAAGLGRATLHAPPR